LALFCGDRHLPNAGGVMDQDYGLLRRMLYLRDVFNTVRKLSTLVGDEINTNLSTDERILLGYLNDERFL
jgi:hypothetical protein